MKPFALFPSEYKASVRYVLTDIDDTLTNQGKFHSCALAAMEELQAKGIKVIPVTGRPAGWCDHIARMWPIDGVVGENGAFYFHYDPVRKKMFRRYWRNESQRYKDRQDLERIKGIILAKVPECKVASDQPYREADLAIDTCEDIPQLSLDSVRAIVEIFRQNGAMAKISSIHVNGWFGDHDKLSMTRLLLAEVHGETLESLTDQILFIGDSPNDEPMFEFFRHSVGVANIMNCLPDMRHLPAWITDGEGGQGFYQMTKILISFETQF